MNKFFPKFTNFTHWLLPQNCFLCGNTSRQLLCTACIADLPYQRNACVNCAKALPETSVCENCQTDPPPYTHTQAVFSYQYPIDKLILAAKFHQNLAVLKLLGNLMAQRLALESSPDILIPVPLHPKRLRKRGYNQSLELAKYITKETGIPLDYKTCQRTKHTRPQATLSKQQRQTNVIGAFQVKNLKSSWQHIVLIDDVMTTGSTVRELAIVFKEAGVATVDVWCCARR